MDHMFSTLEVAQAHAKARVDSLAQVLREHATGQEAAHQGLTVAAAATREHHDVQAATWRTSGRVSVLHTLSGRRGTPRSLATCQRFPHVWQ